MKYYQPVYEKTPPLCCPFNQQSGFFWPQPKYSFSLLPQLPQSYYYVIVRFFEQVAEKKSIRCIICVIPDPVNLIDIAAKDCCILSSHCCLLSSTFLHSPTLILFSHSE